MATTDNTALLIMDVQPGIVERLEEADTYLKKVEDAVAQARQRQLPVIYVVVGFRPGFPEVSANNKSFGAIKAGSGTGLVNPAPSLTPADGEVVVTKRRVSAFTGSDLEVVLRGLDVRHIVLTGIATSGVVLSTLREAADKDYQITVLADLCADMDDEVHRVLVEKVFPRHAEVTTSEAWFDGTGADS
ncbi:MAG TPA: isochorismatase family cysteine hydrolase [Candidatus Saccharimonadales bacterium]|nr:isochorismatase family cysteine hydrolase [Candidatus Saccharimonadales bacterium]